MIAIVGRPNVGKSALVNRILGRREAVVEDTPGVTRDRVSYKAEYLDRRFTLVDTGGWEPDARGIDASVAAQAEVAIDLADAVMFVVDATVGATATDEHVVRCSARRRSPCSSWPTRSTTCARSPTPPRCGTSASASRTRSRRCTAAASPTCSKRSSRCCRTCRPSPRTSSAARAVSRSSAARTSASQLLLNKAAGEERVVVNELAGTTRDPVDEQVELGGKIWRFVDTAGIRRRVHLQQGADFYASLRTAAALEKAEVAVVVLDVSEPISEQDVRIIDLVLESGRALVLAYNKWDLLDDERRRYLEREIEQDLAHVAWAPRVNISARTGRHLEKLVPALETALESWDTRIPTGKFNAFLAELTQEHPHPVRGGKQPRILFGTQASSRPPTFVLFTTGFLDPRYRRFIQRRLREIYGFEGSPIIVNMRVRERRQR